VTDKADVHRAAERAARQSYGKLVAYLAARTGDVAAAEDALAASRRFLTSLAGFGI
jgi:predicted RNA polymerase sigma factor